MPGVHRGQKGVLTSLLPDLGLMGVRDEISSLCQEQQLFLKTSQVSPPAAGAHNYRVICAAPKGFTKCVCVCVRATHTHTPHAVGTQVGQEECQVPWNWSHSWELIGAWTQTPPPARALSAFHCQAVSPAAPNIYFFFFLHRKTGKTAQSICEPVSSLP